MPPFFVHPGGFLLRLHQFHANDRAWSLSDFLEKSPSVESKGEAVLSGKKLLWIRAALPAAPDFVPDANCYCDVYFDPAANFHIAMTSTRVPVPTLGDAPAPRIVSTLEVKRFQDLGNGVFFPLEIEGRAFKEGQVEPISVYRIEVDDLHVNEELSSDAFDFSFPKYAIVLTNPPMEGRARSRLWGDNDRPMGDLTDYSSLIKLAEEHGFSITEGDPSASRSRTILFWCLGVCLALSVLIGVFLRVRKRLAPKGDSP